MWRSPIQICGTVRRPLFCVISARRAGCRSTRIFSTSLTPLSASRRSADWQNGHAAVVYISTFATLLFHRQPGLLPRAEAASEIDDAAEALLPEGGRGLCGALAAVVVDDERLVLAVRELAGVAALQARKRQVARAEDMAGAVVARVAHVEHQRVLAVDELRRLRDRDPGAARRAAHERPEQHGAGDHGGREEKAVMVLLDEFQQGKFHGKSRGPEASSRADHYNSGDVCPCTQMTGRMTGTVHKLILMRHGESQWKLENRFTGWTDVDLTQAGIAEAPAPRRP